MVTQCNENCGGRDFHTVLHIIKYAPLSAVAEEPFFSDFRFLFFADESDGGGETNDRHLRDLSVNVSSRTAGLRGLLQQMISSSTVVDDVVDSNRSARTPVASDGPTGVFQ